MSLDGNLFFFSNDFLFSTTIAFEYAYVVGRFLMFRAFCLFLCVTTHLFCSQESEELLVFLGKETSLFPTYIEEIELDASKFGEAYTKQLTTILSFDIGHNGMNRIVAEKEEKSVQTALGKPKFQENINIKALQATGLAHLIRLQMRGSNLYAKIIEITASTSRNVGPIECSGNLAQDRRKIHSLADRIHQALFGKPGIASSKILFVSKQRLPSVRNEPQYASEVYEADYDGQNCRQLTHTNSLCATPLWIPKRSLSLLKTNDHTCNHFLYVSYQLGQPKFYTLSLYGGSPKRVSTMRGNQLTPTISPDGSQLAFCSDITGTADLYLVQFETSVGAIGKPRQIFHVRGTATACPCFSPDGKKIAFVSNKDGCPRVYMMDIPKIGTKSTDLKPALISKKCRNNTAPCWSPDGKKIAYSARNSGDREIWVYDIEKGSEEQVSAGEGSKESPSWASDSLHLVFHAYTSAGCDIYMINLNQPEPVKISSGSGDKLFAVWEPLDI